MRLYLTDILLRELWFYIKKNSPGVSVGTSFYWLTSSGL